MAMKIRCAQCNKKILIDEAFCGGVCRCPYCKALVLVESKAEGVVGVRPAAPSLRPGAPALQPGAAGARPSAPPSHADAIASIGQPVEHVPMASPVRLQGIVALVLLALLLGMIGGIITLSLMYVQGPGPATQPAPPPVASIFVPKQPGISTLPIKSTSVIYVIDGGGSMRDVFDYAVEFSLRSIQSLEAGSRCEIIEACGKGTISAEATSAPADDTALERSLTGGTVEGGAAKADALRDLVGSRTIGPQYDSDLQAALRAAIDKKPGTIVLFACKDVSGLMDLASDAKSKGIVIVGISLTETEDYVAAMKTLAEATGGKHLAFSVEQLRREMPDIGSK